MKRHLEAQFRTSLKKVTKRFLYRLDLTFVQSGFHQILDTNAL